MLPAAVAEHAVRNAFFQCLRNARGGCKIHIGNGERQQIVNTKTIANIIPLGTPRAVTVNSLRKIKHISFALI